MKDLDEKFFDYLVTKGFNARWFFLASVQNLLLYIISGFSNESTSNMVGLDTQYVRLACESFLGFGGWEKDLDYSPWHKFKNDLLTLEENSDIIAVCERYKNYRKELDDYYDKNGIA